MKLALAEPSYIKDSISIISELVSEARFKVGPDAIELVAMDPANVAMVIFKLFSSAFVEYNVPQKTEFAINLTNFKQVVKRAKQNDVLLLELEDNRLKIQLKGSSVRTFNLPILDIADKEQKIPELKFPVTINTHSSVLNEAIEDADIVADSVSFMVEGKKLTILAEGDLSQAKIEISENETTQINSTITEKIKSKYSIEYLKKMINGSKLSDKVAIHFNKDYPLKLDYVVVDKVMLSFILAPRVEND